MRIDHLAGLWLAVALLGGSGVSPAAPGPATEVYGPADPVQKDAGQFDPKRPPRREMQTDVPDGFTVAQWAI